MASFCESDSLSYEMDDEQMNIDEKLSSVSRDQIVADLVDVKENETRSLEPSEVTDLICSDETISPKSLLNQVTNFFQQNYPLMRTDLLHDGAILPSSYLTKLKDGSEEEMKDSTQITIAVEDPLCVTSTSCKMEKLADEDVIDVSVLYSDKFDQEFKKTETKNQGKKRKRKKKRNAEKEDEIYPTHFIALQIKDKEIHEKVKDLQFKLLERNAKYRKAVVSHEKLHMTLMVFHLIEENMDQAKLALNSAATEIIKMFRQPLHLTVQGLGHFNNKVLFALGENQMLYKIAEIVEESMASCGIFSTDTRSKFKPHVTVMKLSQDPNLYRQGIKKIDPVIWEDYKDTKFGSDCITSLQICLMSGGKDSGCSDGYYEDDSGTSCKPCNNNCPTSACSVNCKQCDQSTGTCRECNKGYYGSSCNLSCSNNCYNEGCNKDGSCSSCKTGYHGSSCQFKCSEGCSTNYCRKTDGSCSCKSGYSGQQCTDKCNNCEVCDSRGCSKCNKGWFGDECHHQCPDNCLDRCDKYDGKCTHCKDNFVGDFCNGTCNGGCKRVETRRICYKNGKCLLGCNDGMYGNACNVSCGVSCEGGCDQDNGKCNKCKSGYHGETCEKCSSQCDGGCDKSDGRCYKCKSGYHGKTCDKSCSSKCVGGCDQESGTCIKCIDGYYGNTCQIRCSNLCKSCEYYSLKCKECKGGYWGLYCNNICSSTCKPRINSAIPVCHLYNGTCTEGCQPGHTGHNCTTACEDGYYGDGCNGNCGKCYNNKPCDAVTGSCGLEGCDSGFTGATCHMRLKYYAMSRYDIVSCPRTTVRLHHVTHAFAVKWTKFYLK